MEECQPTEMEFFDEKANGIFEAFLESMQGDITFVRPIEKDDECVNENWAFVYTYRGQKLATRMLDKLSHLAEKKFGAYAIDIDISSYLYQEE